MSGGIDNIEDDQSVVELNFIRTSGTGTVGRRGMCPFPDVC